MPFRWSRSARNQTYQSNPSQWEEEEGAELLSSDSKWQKHFDETSGFYYLYNFETGESKWLSPSVVDDGNQAKNHTQNSVYNSSDDLNRGIDSQFSCNHSYLDGEVDDYEDTYLYRDYEDRLFDVEDQSELDPLSNTTALERIWSLIVSICEDLECASFALFPVWTAVTGSATVLFVTCSFCSRAHGSIWCSAQSIPTVSYATTFRGRETQLFWTFGMLATALFMMLTTFTLVHRLSPFLVRTKQCSQNIPRTVLSFGLLTSLAMVALAISNFTHSSQVHLVAACIYWIASWGFIFSSSALRHFAWSPYLKQEYSDNTTSSTNTKAESLTNTAASHTPTSSPHPPYSMLPAPFDLRRTFSAWCCSRYSLALVFLGFISSLFSLYYYIKRGSLLSKSELKMLGFDGLSQQIAIWGQLLFVFTLWTDLVAANNVSKYYHTQTMLHQSSAIGGDGHDKHATTKKTREQIKKRKSGKSGTTKKSKQSTNKPLPSTLRK